MIEHLIFTVESAVHYFQTDGDAFVLGASLDPVQKRDSIIRTLRVRHSAALAADHNNVGTAASGALVDSLAESFDPAKYTDDYRANLMKIIRAKMKGKKITVTEPEKEPADSQVFDA